MRARPTVRTCATEFSQRSPPPPFDQATLQIWLFLSCRSGEARARIAIRTSGVLGEPDDSGVDQVNRRVDLALVDLTETRLVSYEPPARSGLPTVVLSKIDDDSTVASFHFCEDDFSLIAAASFLDGFAERIEEPVMQLL